MGNCDSITNLLSLSWKTTKPKCFNHLTHWSPYHQWTTVVFWVPNKLLKVVAIFLSPVCSYINQWLQVSLGKAKSTLCTWSIITEPFYPTFPLFKDPWIHESLNERPWLLYTGDSSRLRFNKMGLVLLEYILTHTIQVSAHKH